MFSTENIKQNRIGEIIENDPPLKKGSKRVYHAFTRDWITNEIFRRVEEKQRTMAEFWREEIETKYDLDVHINLTKENIKRC